MSDFRTLQPIAKLINLLPKIDASGPDKTVVFNHDDLTPEYKQTIADWVSQQTNVNTYALQPGVDEISATNSDGTAAPLSPYNDSGAKNTYLGSFLQSNINSQAPTQFQLYSNSGLLNTDTPFKIKKGYVDDPSQSGDDLLKDVDKNLDRSNFAVRIGEVIKFNNINNIDSQFIPLNGTISPQSTDDDVALGMVQKQYGVHNTNGNAGVPVKVINKDSLLIKMKDLKKIGAIAMLGASGEAYTPTDPNDPLQDLAARGATNVPGLARLGIKVPTSRFSAGNIMAGLNPEFFRRNSLKNPYETEQFSYGSPNNYIVPFAGVTTTASVTSVLILMSVVVAMVKAAVTTIRGTQQLLNLSQRSMSAASNIFDTRSPYDRRRRGRLGSFLEKSNLADIKTYPTNHDFSSCANRGVMLFFGVDPLNIPSGAPGISNAISNSVANIIRSNGFYNTILRNIVRGVTEDFFNSLGLAINTLIPGINVSDTSQAASVNQVGGAGTLANQLDPAAIIDRINNSTLLKFINVVAEIGDVAYALDAKGYDTSSPSSFDISIVSTIDNIKETTDDNILNVGILHTKNRLSTRFNTLAWNTHTTPSLYWFPNQILDGASNFFGTNTNGLSMARAAIDDNVITNSSLENRISSDDVVVIEDQLDAEYMPFYFHDLRTNEIISFHAFLEDLSENYQADYEETEGFGRVGKILTYKNTNRSINVSFRVVSTAPDDFDQMWLKINKLLTLLYPQYSEGRVLVDDQGNKFIQPFSQVITSSPLIRLRLGDLLKTNYSRFGLARLFGVTTAHFQINNQSNQGSSNGNNTNVSTSDQQDQLNQRILQTRNRMEGRIASVPRFQNGEFAILRSNGTPGIGEMFPGAAYQRVDQGSSTISALPTIGTAQPPLIIYYSARARITQVEDNGDVFWVQLENPANGQDGTYLVHSEDLIMDPTEPLRIASQNTNGSTTGTNTTNQSTPTQDFFAEIGNNENAIFKSFATTRGRGLAGFIKSINFDYDQKETIWETDRFNARAPMMMKLSLEFQPIHDLQPGLDAQGFNSAPIYNVGNIMKAFSKETTEFNQTNNERIFMSSRALMTATKTRNGR